jgi:adenine deaminase
LKKGNAWSAYSGRSEIADLLASGSFKADAAIVNGRLVNVHSEEIYEAEVAILGNRVGMMSEKVREFVGPKTNRIDAKGRFLVPGLIDAHYHVAGTYLTMTNLAMSLLARGTTAIAADFYEYGAVCGPRAIRFALDEAKATPLKVLFNVPLLAYLQNDPFGKTGRVNASDLMEMLDWDEATALGEVQPQTSSDKNVRALIGRAISLRKTVVGHYVGFDERGLAAWYSLGPTSDHESVDASEALEKVRQGVKIIAREGSAATDLARVLRVISEKGLDTRRFMLCTDEIDPLELQTLGHMDYKVRKAISLGISPIKAVQMASINAAEYFRVDQDLGSIAPGKSADILLVGDISKFEVEGVIVDGELVAEGGVYGKRLRPLAYPGYMKRSVILPRRLRAADFAVKSEKRSGTERANVIVAKEGLLISGREVTSLAVRSGRVQPDTGRDILKVTVVERHGARLIGNAFIKGFGLRSGALAESFAPVPENIIGVGSSDDDLAFAVNRIREMQGGLVVAADRRTRAELRLPILGLLSEDPIDQVSARFAEVTEAARNLGCPFKSPFLTLMFMGYPLIPTLKITQSGLVDVDLMKYVDVLIH